MEQLAILTTISTNMIVTGGVIGLGTYYFFRWWDNRMDEKIHDALHEAKAIEGYIPHSPNINAFSST